jgi:hypothetical protein
LINASRKKGGLGFTDGVPVIGATAGHEPIGRAGSSVRCGSGKRNININQKYSTDSSSMASSSLWKFSFVAFFHAFRVLAMIPNSNEIFLRRKKRVSKPVDVGDDLRLTRV